ncbi:MAG: HAMP domain-containing histidine kinase [Deltaproteobacteria bacterium]|nr:HAMP domain-containing histidine kinase [Deltaproteobacteria bacterium]
METYFASPERLSSEEVTQQNKAVVEHPVVAGMLRLLSGMLAVLNEDRQVVALNEGLAEYLGVEDLSAAFGLRPGEAVQCIHAHEMPGGCGTGPYCSSCGAAVSIVTSLNLNQPESRKCAMEVMRAGKKQDLFLQVQSVPIEVDKHRFLLLFIQDISAQQKWAAMEQVFFHDINNILAGVVAVSNLLLMESTAENRDMVQQLSLSSRRISQEVALQRCLLNSEAHSYTPMWSRVSLHSVFDELSRVFDTHPAAQGKRLRCARVTSETVLKTDHSLLLRVLNNMLVNAFEATSADGTVIVDCRETEHDVCFSVWNEGTIPKALQHRLFQRNVSTKGGLGRGIGTYSMKLFGEELLRGKVDFVSNSETGTTFQFTLSKDDSGSIVSVAPLGKSSP